MTSDETAWVAGILEGEGCFDYNGGHKKRYPRIRVEMCDTDVVERLHALIGCGRLSYPTKRGAKPQWRSTALLVINGREHVEPLLRAVRPWLGVRRGEKVDELLGAYASVRETC